MKPQDKLLSINEPLKFGDMRQINLIKEHQKFLDTPDDPAMTCYMCDGEGKIICTDCEGMGVKDGAK